MTAQILGVLFTPFLARIYGPEAYGIFALLMAVVNNLSQISTLQLPTGYVAAENDRAFLAVLRISLIILFSFSSICMGVFFFFGEEIITFFSLEELRSYLFWIPVYLILMGLDNILLGWNIRLKEFKRGAVAKVSSTIISRGVSLIIGVAYPPSATGIIAGNLLVYPVEGAMKLSKAIRSIKLTSIFKTEPWHEWKSVLRKYKEYIFFVTPGVFLTNFSNLLPIYCFSIAFSEKEVGYFAMASSLVSMPLTLIVNSSITVFLQKAAETISQSKEDLSRLVLSLYKKLFFIGFVPLVLIAVTAKWIFLIVFGPDWAQAGLYVSFLCVAYSFNVVYGPLSVLFRLLNFERVNFLTTVIFFGIRLLALWIGVWYNDIVISIIGYSIASLLAQLTLISLIFRRVQLSLWILARNAIVASLFAALVIWLNT